MAEVFLAASASAAGLYKLVVLKRLRREFVRDAAFVEMFMHEAAVATRLNHANVVQTFEFGEDRGEYFLAMEYLEGRSLCEILRELPPGERVDPAVAAFVVSEALAGLHYAHDLCDYQGKPLGIVHRDVSPQNILITYDGQVKVVDFGIAKAAHAPETQAGLIKGKLMYMAPEMASPAFGPTIDRRADIFAMGIVLWELIAGRRLFEGDSRDAFAQLLNSVPLPRVETIHPEADPALSKVAERALRKPRESRYSTAQEMREPLEAFAAARGAHARRELGALVSRLFADERAEVQRKIKDGMAALEAAEHRKGRPTDLALWATTDRDLSLPSLPFEYSGTPPPSSIGSIRGVPPASRDRSREEVGSNVPPPEATTEVRAPPRSSGHRATILSICLLAAGLLIAAIAAVRPPWAGSPASSTAMAVAASLSAEHGSRPEARPSVEPVAPPSPEPAAVAPVSPFVAAPKPSSSVAPLFALDGPHPRKPPGPTSSPGAQTSPLKSKAAPAPAFPPPFEPGLGFLTLDTYPWTQVAENGRLLGTTPLVGVPLSPGTHTLTLENPDQQMRRSYTVTIKSGETVARRLAFQ
jgi:serine/threonine-protein kinase